MAETEFVTINEAAKRLGVSPDTVRRRLKRGDLQGEREKTPQGFVWRIILPRDASDATEPQGAAIERELLRERLDELRAERDAWRGQAQRSGEAERELRVLLRNEQLRSLPAETTRQDPPGATEEPSPVSGVMREERASPARRLWAWLRG